VFAETLAETVCESVAASADGTPSADLDLDLYGANRADAIFGGSAEPAPRPSKGRPGPSAPPAAARPPPKQKRAPKAAARPRRASVVSEAGGLHCWAADVDRHAGRRCFTMLPRSVGLGKRAVCGTEGGGLQLLDAKVSERHSTTHSLSTAGREGWTLSTTSTSPPPARAVNQTIAQPRPNSPPNRLPNRPPTNPPIHQPTHPPHPSTACHHHPPAVPVARPPPHPPPARHTATAGRARAPSPGRAARRPPRRRTLLQRLPVPPRPAAERPPRCQQQHRVPLWCQQQHRVPPRCRRRSGPSR
jgi:hypothetical protein